MSWEDCEIKKKAVYKNDQNLITNKHNGELDDLDKRFCSPNRITHGSKLLSGVKTGSTKGKPVGKH